MSVQRAIFVVTCDSNGQGADDAQLKLPSALSRHAELRHVSVDSSSSTALVMPSVSINELDDATGIAVPVTAESYEIGRQLFHADAADVAYDAEFDVRDTVTATSGLGVATYGGFQLIRTKNVRCIIAVGSPSGVYTVNMYYETAGDYRF